MLSASDPSSRLMLQLVMVALVVTSPSGSIIRLLSEPMHVSCSGVSVAAAPIRTLLYCLVTVRPAAAARQGFVENVVLRPAELVHVASHADDEVLLRDRHLGHEQVQHRRGRHVCRGSARSPSARLKKRAGFASGAPILTPPVSAEFFGDPLFTLEVRSPAGMWARAENVPLPPAGPRVGVHATWLFGPLGRKGHAGPQHRDGPRGACHAATACAVAPRLGAACERERAAAPSGDCEEAPLRGGRSGIGDAIMLSAPIAAALRSPVSRAPWPPAA
jgi:hypothetical protein